MNLFTAEESPRSENNPGIFDSNLNFDHQSHRFYLSSSKGHLLNRNQPRKFSKRFSEYNHGYHYPVQDSTFYQNHHPKHPQFFGSYDIPGGASLGFRSDSIGQPTIYQTPHYSPDYGKAASKPPALKWILEPPRMLRFSNSTGGRLECQVEDVEGAISTKWIMENGKALIEVICSIRITEFNDKFG